MNDILMLKPPLPYQLRPLRPSDIEAVLAIEKTAFPSPWQASSFHYEVTENRIAKYQALTVRQGDQPSRLIGYAGYWLLVDELHISTIATHPSWRGQGLGELLLINLLFMGYEEPAQLATLEVRAGNTVAQSLYQKYDFAIVGERRRYYQNKEDALIMTVEPLDKAYRQLLAQRRDALYQRLTTSITPTGTVH
jgi:[ribosomal protein S18]-alanine N-acetyltransferase